MVPVGGGGMISGIAKAVKQIKPNIRIVGVEPSKIPSMRKAVVDHDLSVHPAVTTIADGINVSCWLYLLYIYKSEVSPDFIYLYISVHSTTYRSEELVK